MGLFDFLRRKRLPEFSSELQALFADSRLLAIRLQNDFISPEHLVLAMLELPDGSVSGLLNAILVSPALLRNQLEQELFGHRAAPDEPLPTGSIAITTELEACLHTARGMAAEARVPEVAPEHVLLPILFRAEATGQTGYTEIGLTVAVLAARIGVPTPGR